LRRRRRGGGAGGACAGVTRHATGAALWRWKRAWCVSSTPATRPPHTSATHAAHTRTHTLNTQHTTHPRPNLQQQVNLDFESEADMVDKFRIGLALQPIAVALFANSPFVEGKPSGMLSTRGGGGAGAGAWHWRWCLALPGRARGRLALAHALVRCADWRHAVWWCAAHPMTLCLPPPCLHTRARTRTHTRTRTHAPRTRTHTHTRRQRVDGRGRRAHGQPALRLPARHGL
jgi:hypothetical protein